MHENAAEIVTTPGVDMVYIGPGDFSVEMGQPGDWDHPDVVGPAEEILDLCKAHNVPFGTTAAGADRRQRLRVLGARRYGLVAARREKAVLKLMFGAMIRAAERWRAIRVSELERRQMRAVREELDHEYEAQNGLGTKASTPARQAQISSTSRT